MDRHKKFTLFFGEKYRLDFKGIIPHLDKSSLENRGYSYLLPEKPMQIAQLLRESDVASLFYFEEPPEARHEELVLAHTEEHIARTKQFADIRACFEIKEEPQDKQKLTTPMLEHFVDMQILAPVRRIVGGTIASGKCALKDGFSANLAGGYHHASANAYSGFCVYNDVAIAVLSLKNLNTIERALVVDLDVHQGDGTARIFQNDPTTYTFSMHRDDIHFPRVFATSSCDIPIKRQTTDREYMALLKQGLPKAIAQSRPDIIFYIAGSDTLNIDLVGGTQMTEEGIAERDRFVYEQARKYNTPLAMVSGGGYSDASVRVYANSIINAVKFFSGQEPQKAPQE